MSHIFPLLDGVGLDALAQDIQENGQREPLYIYEDKILDGRNRYLACERAGVTPFHEVYQGDDPVKFVIRLNLHRRHLNEIKEINEGGKLAEVIKRHVHVAQNSGQNEWYTPDEFLDLARQVMGGIDLDPASSEIAQQRVDAKIYFTQDDDGLNKDWSGRVWMNPPYEGRLIKQLSAKLCESLPNIDAIAVLASLKVISDLPLSGSSNGAR